MTTQSLETLKHEYRVIEIGLDVLDAMAQQVEQGTSVNPKRIKALLDFFTVFTNMTPNLCTISPGIPTTHAYNRSILVINARGGQKFAPSFPKAGIGEGG